MIAYDINEGGIHQDSYEIWVTCPDVTLITQLREH